MGIENVQDADPRTKATIFAIIRELLRLCPLCPAPSLSVKAIEHVSCYDPETDTIYICYSPDWDIPVADDLLAEIPWPKTWSSLLSEVVEEFVHAYQARMQAEEPSQQAVNFWRQYYKNSWGAGHGPDFFEAVIRFTNAAGLSTEEVMREISRGSR